MHNYTSHRGTDQSMCRKPQEQCLLRLLHSTSPSLIISFLRTGIQKVPLIWDLHSHERWPQTLVVHLRSAYFVVTSS